ncbi:MAG: hypothetical protein H7122_12345 [Chitinophagaceae bacterium]|nr:hypothetical protein [Chitinophagaceae bacterium]
MQPTVKKLSLHVSEHSVVAPHAEQEIIFQITEKNTIVFGNLYDHYAPVLMGILIRMNLNKESAGLILERVFKSIWNRPSDLYHMDDKLFTRLLFITKREVFMELKEKKNFIKKHISSLPLSERTCFELVCVYGFTPAQVTLLTKIPVGRVRECLENGMRKFNK